MKQVTLRLEGQDHSLLQLACLLTKKSQNSFLTDLLHDEIDRLMPGKRAALAENRDPQDLWRSLGLPVPAADPMAQRWADELIASVRAKGDQGPGQESELRRAA